MYPILITLHLFCAIFFIGVVTFEVVFLEKIRKHMPIEVMGKIQIIITTRARKIMPFVMITLFSTGIGMADMHIASLSDFFNSSFGILLLCKIILATSVLIHFITAMTLSLTGKMTCDRFKKTHLSVFAHQIVIVFLAKNMFFL
ncbi:MAG: hypothetical protein GY787_25525 [Alteromonadales bacterium]|nr:hypothetical protein [Alteromonadales bacterium]